MDERAKEVIRLLTDHTVSAAYPEWMLGAGEGSDDFVKNGFAPRGTDLRVEILWINQVFPNGEESLLDKLSIFVAHRGT